jgi:hypothetical protein
VWFPAGGILPNEIHVATTTQVMSRETGLSVLSGDLQLVRYEVISIALPDGIKHHVSIFSAYAPSHFSASYSRTAAKIEAAIDAVAIHLADSYVVFAYDAVSGQTLAPTRTDNAKYTKPSQELFGCDASSQAFRNAVREKRFFMHN